MELTVKLGRLELPNPIMVASGTFGYVEEFAELLDLSRLGAVIPKTITMRARRGNPPPRTVETPSGLLNSIGLDNDGLEHFIRERLPRLARLGVRLIVNIAGRDADEFAAMAERLAAEPGLAAIELNLSCPNVAGGMNFSVEPELTAAVVRLVRHACHLPIIAQLTPNVADIVPVVQAAAEAGADAVALANTFVGLAVDWRRRRPRLGGNTGGLSGPAIKPLVLRLVWQAASATHCPIVGIGGISSIDDVMEYIVAGATAVQVGTANFFDPTIAGRLVEQLPAALAEAGVSSVAELAGTLQPYPPADEH